MKFIFGNLNSVPYHSHPTNTYICRVIIAPKVHNGSTISI